MLCLILLDSFVDVGSKGRVTLFDITTYPLSHLMFMMGRGEGGGTKSCFNIVFVKMFDRTKGRTSRKIPENDESLLRSNIFTKTVLTILLNRRYNRGALNVPKLFFLTRS